MAKLNNFQNQDFKRRVNSKKYRKMWNFDFESGPALGNKMWVISI